MAKTDLCVFPNLQSYTKTLASTWCQVCFMRHPYILIEDAFFTTYSNKKESSINSNREFAFCKKCKNGGHVYCLGSENSFERQYIDGPDSEELEVKVFTCDACQHNDDTNANSKVRRHNIANKLCCKVCDKNTGLLTQTEDKEWIHTICGLIGDEFRCNNFSKMKFTRISRIEEKKGAKCGICNGKIKEAIKCQDQGCPKVAHLYCLMKERVEVMLNEGLEEDNDRTWNYALPLSSTNWRREKINLDFAKFFDENFDIGQEMAAKEITDQDLALLCINDKKTMKNNYVQKIRYHKEAALKQQVEEKVQENVYMEFKCGKHHNQISYCICKEIRDDNFVSCDECQIWYHCKCIGASYELVTQRDYFVCKKCEHLKECLKLGFHDS
jgi:hypothetical protein